MLPVAAVCLGVSSRLLPGKCNVTGILSLWSPRQQNVSFLPPLLPPTLPSIVGALKKDHPPTQPIPHKHLVPNHTMLAVVLREDASKMFCLADMQCYRFKEHLPLTLATDNIPPNVVRWPKVICL